MEYHKFAGPTGVEYVRISHADESAEYFDTYEGDWVRQDVYYDEIVYRGEGGSPLNEADVMAALGLNVTAA
jgi:hypothetical protein